MSATTTGGTRRTATSTTVEFTPIGSDATRVAAFCPARWTWFIRCRFRTSSASTTTRERRALTGPELRTIFLGMDQMRDELLYSDVKGKNPFKDVPCPQGVLPGDRHGRDQAER
jgi:peptide/nickel transport system substrate-binding protein